jgi:hypothetical protein
LIYRPIKVNVKIVRIRLGIKAKAQNFLLYLKTLAPSRIPNGNRLKTAKNALM